MSREDGRRARLRSSSQGEIHIVIDDKRYSKFGAGSRQLSRFFPAALAVIPGLVAVLDNPCSADQGRVHGRFEIGARTIGNGI